MNPKIKKITIDKNLCIGCSSCAVIAPGAFQLNSDGKADLLPDWKKTADKELTEAAQSCPTKSITLYSEDKKQIYS